MKIKAETIFLTILVCLLANSCLKEKLETTYKKQGPQIDSYLSKNNTAKRDSTIIYEDGSTKDTTVTDTLRIISAKPIPYNLPQDSTLELPQDSIAQDSIAY